MIDDKKGVLELLPVSTPFNRIPLIINALEYSFYD